MQKVTGVGGVFLRGRDAAALRAWYAEVIDEIEEAANGRFAWAVDPEGNRFELWQPSAGQ